MRTYKREAYQSSRGGLFSCFWTTSWKIAKNHYLYGKSYTRKKIQKFTYSVVFMFSFKIRWTHSTQFKPIDQLLQHIKNGFWTRFFFFFILKVLETTKTSCTYSTNIQNAQYYSILCQKTRIIGYTVPMYRILNIKPYGSKYL